MESDHELRDKIIAFLQGVIDDLQVNHAADQGDIALIREKCRGGGYGDIEEAIRDVQTASHNTGYQDGLVKMAKDIVKLLEDRS